MLDVLNLLIDLLNMLIIISTFGLLSTKMLNELNILIVIIMLSKKLPSAKRVMSTRYFITMT